MPVGWRYDHRTCALLSRRGKKNKKTTKCILYFFFLPRGHHFKMSCCGCEFLSAFPLLFCLEANPLISCVSMDLQRTIFYVCVCVWEKRKSTSFSWLFFFFFLVCLICTTTSKWLQCYCALFVGDDLNLVSAWTREKRLTGLSVCARSENQRLQSRSGRNLFSVHVDYSHSRAPIVALSFKHGSESGIFLWRRYSLSLVFKDHKLTSTNQQAQSCQSVCMLWECV